MGEGVKKIFIKDDVQVQNLLHSFSATGYHSLQAVRSWGLWFWQSNSSLVWSWHSAVLGTETMYLTDKFCDRLGFL